MRFTSLIVFLVLARLLSPDSFGLVSLATVFIALLQVFVEQGFSQAIIQRKTLEPGHLDSAFWLSTGMGLLMTAIAVAAAGAISDVLNQPDFAPILRGLSVSLFISGLASVPEAILRRDLAFRSLAYRTLIGSVAGGVVGVTLAFSGAGAWSLVFQLLVQAAVSTTVLWLAVPWRPGLNVSVVHLRELFSFSVNIIGIELLNFLNRRTDDILIAAVLGTTALGYYTVAYRILLILTEVMTQTINAVTLPTFSRVQDSIPRLRSAYLMATRISATVATPVFLALAALAPQVIPVVFGSKWDPAVPVMQVLAFIGVLHAYLYFSGTVLISIGQPRKALYISTANAVSNVVAFAIAVHWGIVAVAAAYVIRGYILSPLPVYLVKQVLGFKWRSYLRVTLVPVAASAVMIAAILALRIVLLPVLGEALLLLALALVAGPVYWLTMRTFADRYIRQAADFIEPASPRLSRMLLWTPTLGARSA